jgi:hypothetical protein
MANLATSSPFVGPLLHWIVRDEMLQNPSLKPPLLLGLADCVPLTLVANPWEAHVLALNIVSHVPFCGRGSDVAGVTILVAPT